MRAGEGAADVVGYENALGAEAVLIIEKEGSMDHVEVDVFRSVSSFVVSR